MGKNARLNNGSHKRKRTDSHQGSQFFSPQKKQKRITSSPEIKETKKTKEKQQPVQEIKVETTTEFLLAAIAQALETRNKIELMKLQTQEEQEQLALQEAKEMEEQEKTQFEEIRHSMYL